MSYRDVFDVFKRERRLSDDETALLNSLRHMTDAERELLAETLGPPAKVKVMRTPSKKLKRCDVCGISKRAAHHRDVGHPDYHEFDSGARTAEKKSSRRPPLAEKIAGTAGTRVTDNAKCAYAADGKICLGLEGDSIHDKSMGYSGYHPFVSSSSARSAVAQSSTSGSEASSGIDSEGVLSAAGG